MVIFFINAWLCILYKTIWKFKPFILHDISHLVVLNLYVRLPSCWCMLYRGINAQLSQISQQLFCRMEKHVYHLHIKVHAKTPSLIKNVICKVKTFYTLKIVGVHCSLSYKYNFEIRLLGDFEKTAFLYIVNLALNTHTMLYLLHSFI